MLRSSDFKSTASLILILENREDIDALVRARGKRSWFHLPFFRYGVSSGVSSIPEGTAEGMFRLLHAVVLHAESLFLDDRLCLDTKHVIVVCSRLSSF